MRYLLLMTLSGSALFIGYLVWIRVFGNSVTQNIKYKALVTVLLTYAVPWAWLRNIYRHTLRLFWYEGAIIDLNGKVNLAEIKAGRESYKTIDYKLLTVFMGVWLLGAILLVVIKGIKFYKRKHSLQRLAIECCDENLVSTIERLQQELHCWRKPKVVRIRANSGTLTLGVIRPVIFLQKEYTERELYWLLKHEMIHITRRDMAIKLIQEFVRCFHWFNPFVHILMYKIDLICEASCDERVIKGTTKDEQEAYAILIDKSSRMLKKEIPIGGGLESSDEEIQERIELIRNMGKGQGGGRGTAIIIFALLVFIDSLTALAYPKVRHVEDAAVEYSKELADGGNFWLNDYEEEGYDEAASTIRYPEQFIDGADNISPADSDSIKEPCIKHDMIKGYYQKHIGYDDGSCAIEMYEGMRCIKCGSIEIGSYYMTTDYDICIHPHLLNRE